MHAKVDPAHLNAPDWDSMTMAEKQDHFQRVTRRYLEAEVDDPALSAELAKAAWINMPPDLKAKHTY